MGRDGQRKMDAWAKVIAEQKKEKEAERRLKERKGQEKEERWQEAQKIKDKAYAADTQRRKAIDAEQERKKESDRKMQQYINDFKAPRTPAPRLPRTKEGEKGKGKDNDTRETKGGKTAPPQTPTRSLSTREESIAKGEKIESDWEPFADREDRLRRECEENGETFYKEDDWSMAERQADDKRRAQEKAK